jgi:hypothetical protein
MKSNATSASRLFIHIPRLIVHIHLIPHSNRPNALTPRQMQCSTIEANPDLICPYPPFPHFILPQPIHILPQPNPPKQQYDGRKEAQPRLPPNARRLRHPQHAIHRPL